MLVCEWMTHSHWSWISGKNVLNISRAPMNTKSFLESTESHLSSSGIFFPRHPTVNILKEIQTKKAKSGIRPGEFEDKIIFMFMLSDIDWTENSNECFSNSRKVRDYAKKDFRRETGLVSLLVMKKMVRSAKTTNLKDNGIVPQMSWNPISKTADIQFSEHPVRWAEDTCEKRWEMCNSLQGWFVECRDFISLSKFSRPVK